MFISYYFITFLLLLFFLYYVVPKKCQWMVLLIANFIFYCFAGRWYWAFLLVSASSLYFSGILLNKQEEKRKQFEAREKNREIPAALSKEERKQFKKKTEKKRKAVLLCGLFFNLGILAVTKYTDFAIYSIHELFHMGGEFQGIDLIVPLGISFYTFQGIAYLLDVYWNRCEPQKNFLKFLLFLSFFPQLIQGPISRYPDLSKTLYQAHKFDIVQVRNGVERILWGYFKKLVIADRIAPAAAMIASDTGHYTGWFVFLGMMFWSIQLYADFTGGIDIVIGIANVLGIEITENFERPFFSKNIAEYWRRWHITMGSWFRDYVFYPMSISRPLKKLTGFVKKHISNKAARRVSIYISTIVLWFATGIWHGAAWFYVVWGLANGIIIILSEELKPLYAKFHKRFGALTAGTGYKVFQVLRTFLLMSCLRMFDIYGSAKTTFLQFFHMFTQIRPKQFQFCELLDMGLGRADYIIVLAGTAVMFLVSYWGRKTRFQKRIENKPYIVHFGLILILFFSILLLGQYGIGYDVKQFIYNQF